MTTTLAAPTKQYTAYASINLCISLPIHSHSYSESHIIAQELINDLLIQEVELKLKTLYGTNMHPQVHDWHLQLEEIDED